VKRLTMLVTPDGKWVFPNTPEFFAALGDTTPDYDAVAFAVKNLGFISYQVIEQSIVEIELHPRNVELPALLAAQQQLLNSQVQLFRIKFFDTRWESEISSSAEHTIDRLSELCAPVFTPRTSERFIVEPQDFSHVFKDEGSALRPLAQKWRVSFGHFDPTVISLAVRYQLLSRLMIAGMKPRAHEPVWRFIGEGHKWIGEEYQLFGVGQKVENMPDKEYGGWATPYYKSVAASGQPRFDLVTAAIQYEDEAAKPRRPVRYERLMLPWKTPSDEVLVTMCSRIAGSGIAAANEELASESSVIRKFARSS
jgi:hypothetical protein